jgi:transposase
MNCRKCGAKQVTRRSAGIFFCEHCGFQPGPLNLDRFGTPTPSLRQLEAATQVANYEFAERKPRIKAEYKGETDGKL